MKRKIYRHLTLTILTLLVMIGSLFLIPVNAKGPEVSYDSTYHYTTQVGQLGGAAYEILMPDNWNGYLVVGCKGYTLSTQELPTINSLNTHTIGIQFMTSSASTRFAYAESNYGKVGFCMQEGMIHTHQLTQYVIDNFGVTGKVFLIGLSMGGQIALMLTNKYPDLYAGVLDVCGNKDTVAFYNYWSDLTKLPATASAIRTYLNGPPTNLPTVFTSHINDASCLLIQASAAQVMADVEAECGGTPESKPQAYERISPTSNPELSVPVISMVARWDLKVPIQHFNDYYDALNTAGSLGNYRSYVFATSQHCDTTIINNVPTYFQKLFNWVEGGIVPPVTPKPLP